MYRKSSRNYGRSGSKSKKPSSVSSVWPVDEVAAVVGRLRGCLVLLPRSLNPNAAAARQGARIKQRRPMALP